MSRCSFNRSTSVLVMLLRALNVDKAQGFQTISKYQIQQQTFHPTSTSINTHVTIKRYDLLFDEPSSFQSDVKIKMTARGWSLQLDLLLLLARIYFMSENSRPPRVLFETGQRWQRRESERWIDWKKAPVSRRKEDEIQHQTFPMASVRRRTSPRNSSTSSTPTYNL